MIVVFKKKKLCVSILLLTVIVGLSGASVHFFAAKGAFLPGGGNTVIIDAGHGAPDGGAVAQNGVLEKDLNLKIARHLQQFLEANGVQVIVTRSDDNGIYDVDGTIRSKKNSDLKNREKLMKSYHADAFVSIHMNKFPESKYSGPQVFYAPNGKKSEQLAKTVQASLVEVLKPSSAREVKRADKSIYLLSKAKLPAILVECGFLSNEEERNKLQNETYQKQVAWAIFGGIMKYFQEE